MSISFTFEMAIIIPDEQSTSVGFIGVFDKGRKITIARRDQLVAYTYALPTGSVIKRGDFEEIIGLPSLGKYWGQIKTDYPLIEKHDDWATFEISADYWGNSQNDAVNSASITQEWRITSDSAFAF